MSRTESHTILPRLAIALLVTGGLLTLSALPRPVTAQEKKAEAKKAEAKPQEKKAEAKPQEKKTDAKPAEKKADAKPAEKKAEAKPAGEEGRRQARRRRRPRPSRAEESRPPAPAPAADDPAKLKAQVTALQQEVAQLKLKVATLELEKLGASVSVDKGKDGKEIATVNILKKWAGDKDAMQLLKNVPNLQVVYIDNNQVNDAALAPLKDLPALRR